MITVRFPNGQVVQYNNGMFFVHCDNYNKIYTKKDGDLLAIIPMNCIIEWVTPCRVYNPMASVPNEKMEELTKEIKALKRKLYRMKK